MSTLTTAEYLKYANLQMAAEAFIRNEATGELATSADAIVAALIAGNKRSLKFTQPQADAFTAQWEVVDQKANTNTGFSGTLFKAIKDDPANGIRKDELVLSFRSTEFIDDHARDNKATNDLEIDGTGFALGQIADMEKWYATLFAPGGALAGKSYSVTGYSLGGHLATVFNQLRQAELQAGPPAAILDQVITFNGAGVGQIGNGTLTALVDRFVDLRGMANGADGLASLFQTTKGKQAYQALRTAIEANQGVPKDTMRDTVAKIFGTLVEGDALLQADRDLLLGANGALTRALKVSAVAVDIPKLNSGDKDSAKPAVITADKIDADGVDYQLAVLTAQAEFNTRSRLTVASDYRIAQGLVSGATRRYFFGDERGNVLDGRAANGNSVADHLYGMAGQDVLIGGGGNDQLDGGPGLDSYVWSEGDGDDTTNTDTSTSPENKGDWLDGGARDDILLGDPLHKSRRWRHGDIAPITANQNLWRNAA